MTDQTAIDALKLLIPLHFGQYCIDCRLITETVDNNVDASLGQRAHTS